MTLMQPKPQSEEDSVNALVRDILGVMAKHKLPILLHAAAIAAVTATLATQSGQSKEMRAYIADAARRMIVERKKETH